MKKQLANILVGVLCILGVGLLVHQRFMCDSVWFDWEQFWHHENLAVICFASAISLLIGRHLRRK